MPEGPATPTNPSVTHPGRASHLVVSEAGKLIISTQTTEEKLTAMVCHIFVLIWRVPFSNSLTNKNFVNSDVQSITFIIAPMQSFADNSLFL